MNRRSFLGHFRSLIPRRAAMILMALVMLTWSRPAFCDTRADLQKQIFEAAKSGDTDKINAILKGVPDLVSSKDDTGMTPLHWAARLGHKDVAELLLAKGADANAKDNAGEVPLQYCAVNDFRDVAELLLAKGAGADIKDNYGNTPMYTAVGNHHKDVVELLLAKGAEVDARNDRLWTPLGEAAGAGDREIAELLLAKGADVNARIANSDTPLHKAALGGHKDVVELLLANRADVNVKSSDGWTPSDVAARNGHEDMAGLIAFSSPPTNWPSNSGELKGSHEVRVKNPNDFNVRVGLRSDGKGKDFIVSPDGTESVNVPNGRYEIYFHYSSDPSGLYQGDSFTLENNGVEITITKVVNGNYGIRKVK